MKKYLSILLVFILVSSGFSQMYGDYAGDDESKLYFLRMVERNGMSSVFIDKLFSTLNPKKSIFKDFELEYEGCEDNVSEDASPESKHEYIDIIKGLEKGTRVSKISRIVYTENGECAGNFTVETKYSKYSHDKSLMIKGKLSQTIIVGNEMYSVLNGEIKFSGDYKGKITFNNCNADLDGSLDNETKSDNCVLELDGEVTKLPRFFMSCIVGLTFFGDIEP